MSSERQPPDDRDLEAFLAGRGRISQAYGVAKDEDTAPAELDAAILEMARAEARRKIVRRPRWLAPLALAATLALSLSVLMTIWRDPVLRDQTGVELIPEPAEIPTLRTPAAEVLSDSVETKKAEAMERAIPPRAKSAPPPPPMFAPETAPQATPDQALESGVVQESEHRSERDSGAAMSAPADAASDLSAPKAAQRQSLSAPAASAPVRSIEAWIEDIRALRARGDIAAAERELRALRLAYPDYVLPDDLEFDETN